MKCIERIPCNATAELARYRTRLGGSIDTAICYDRGGAELRLDTVHGARMTPTRLRALAELCLAAADEIDPPPARKGGTR